MLEIGFGPGADSRRASQQAAFVAGVDHSDVMVKQASKRNASAIREGRVELHARLAPADCRFRKAHFDKVSRSIPRSSGRILSARLPKWAAC